MKARRASSLVLSFIGVRFSLLFSARGGATAFLIIDWFCIREGCLMSIGNVLYSYS